MNINELLFCHIEFNLKYAAKAAFCNKTISVAPSSTAGL